MTAVKSHLPPISVPLIDQSGKMNPYWYQYFLADHSRVGGNAVDKVDEAAAEADAASADIATIKTLPFVTVSASATLSAERVATAGTGITITDGGANSTLTTSIANTTVTAGSYGDASHVANITVNAQGQLTGAGNVSIAIGPGAIALTDAHIIVGNGTGKGADVAVSGDISLADTGAVTIASHAVSNAKFRQSAARSVVGVSGNATADIADISAGNATDSVLRESSGSIGFGTVATAGIANNAVTYGKIQAVTTNKLLGSGNGTAAAEITLGTGLSFSGTTLNAAVSGSTALTSAHIYVGNATNIATDVAMSGDATMANTGALTIANDAVTYAKMQNVSATSRAIGRNTAGSGDPEEVTMSQILDWVGSAAQGDILYRDSSSWARLGAGTSGQALVTQGAAANPIWSTVGAGSGGALSLIQHNAPTGGNVTTFSSIPSTYKHLMILYSARTTESAVVSNEKLTFNSDTGGNYTYNSSQVAASATANGVAGASSIALVLLAGNSATSGRVGSGVIHIENYADTNQNKGMTITGQAMGNGTLSGCIIQAGGGEWFSNAAINRIDITLAAAGNFTSSGNTFDLYGIS